LIAVLGHQFEKEAGGLSGAPVRDASLMWLSVSGALKDTLPIIGVGVFQGGGDAVKNFRLVGEIGTNLFCFEFIQGPELIKESDSKHRRLLSRA